VKCANAGRVGQLRKMLRDARKRKLSAGLTAGSRRGLGAKIPDEKEILSSSLFRLLPIAKPGRRRAAKSKTSDFSDLPPSLWPKRTVRLAASRPVWVQSDD
jgi:hypothetical protein